MDFIRITQADIKNREDAAFTEGLKEARKFLLETAQDFEQTSQRLANTAINRVLTQQEKLAIQVQNEKALLLRGQAKHIRKIKRGGT